jgi:hypothetical protein
MGTAYITEFGQKTFAVRDNGEKTYRYDQGGGVESPTVVHADIFWIKGALKKYIVTYEGDSLPEVLIVKDGGVPGYHEYHRRRAT